MTEPTPNAALSELIRLAEDAGLYDVDESVPLPEPVAYRVVRGGYQSFYSVSHRIEAEMFASKGGVAVDALHTADQLDARARHAADLERAKVVAFMRSEGREWRDKSPERADTLSRWADEIESRAHL